jgi:hypothetical protein
VLALSLVYALYEDRVAQSLVAQNEQELDSFNAMRSQLDGLQARIKTLDARPEPPSTPAADTIIVHPTGSHHQSTEGSGLKERKLPLRTQRKVIEERHSDLSAPHSNFKKAHTEQTGLTDGTPDEVALSQRSSEQYYHEFDIDKSKQFQKEGPLGIRLKKADTKHQCADLELMVNDQNLSQTHVNLYQPVMFYRPDSSQPVEVVIDNISNDHIHGYVTAPENRQSEPTSSSSNTPNTAAQSRSVAAERQRAGARSRRFSVNKILSRLKLRSDG